LDPCGVRLARSTVRALIERQIGQTGLNKNDCCEIIAALGIVLMRGINPSRRLRSKRSI